MDDGNEELDAGSGQSAVRHRARDSGLVHATADCLTIRRRRCGRGFTFLDDRGRRIRDSAAIARARSLAIPPAYTDVRIAVDPRHHLQAVGRDEAGRLQYLYHADWEQVREASKMSRLAALCEALPAIRGRIARAPRKPGLGRDKALAAAVRLIDLTHIRVGSRRYLHSGRSRGAATLLKRNLCCDGGYVHLAFHGKRRQRIECSIRAPALARALRDLGELPGRWAFQYRDADGRRQRLLARDINAYLRQVSGRAVTAKDFRMLAATAAVAERLHGVAPAAGGTARRRQLAAVMAAVAELLGNTPAVLRRSYVDRRIVEAFEAGRLLQRPKPAARHPRLSRGEALVAGLVAAGKAREA